MDRGYSYRGEVRQGHFFILDTGTGNIGLGNWPHMSDNGPHLSTGTFRPLGRFVPGTFCT